MRADIKMGDEVILKDELLNQAQKKAEAKMAKTRAEYVIEEEEGELSEEDKEILDEVDEEDVSEISLEPENEEIEK